jgi:hypothetical protein
MPSLLEALELKYGDVPVDSCLTDEELEPPTLSGSPRSAALSVSIFIPKKSPRHTVPALLVLQDCDIECAGADDEKLRSKCRNVEELDLAQNKLSKWDEVFGILRHMPKIKFVNLSFNSLPEALEVRFDFGLGLKSFRPILMQSVLTLCIGFLKRSPDNPLRLMSFFPVNLILSSF